MPSLPLEEMRNEALLAYGKKKGPYLSDAKFDALKAEFIRRGLDKKIIYAENDREFLAIKEKEASSSTISKEFVGLGPIFWGVRILIKADKGITALKEWSAASSAESEKSSVESTQDSANEDIPTPRH